MNQELLDLLNDFSGAEGAAPDALAKIETIFDRKLPVELREILTESNGIAGVISNHELQIWSAEEIIAYNQANAVQQYTPQFLMFGSTGGGETYTLDYRTTPPSVVLVAAIGFDYQSAILIGVDFMGFLRRLKDPRSLFDKID